MMPKKLIFADEKDKIRMIFVHQMLLRPASHPPWRRRAA